MGRKDGQRRGERLRCRGPRRILRRRCPGWEAACEPENGCGHLGREGSPAAAPAGGVTPAAVLAYW